MLETIIDSGSDIVRRSERVIENARKLVFAGHLDNREVLSLYREADRLMEAMFAMKNAVAALRHSLAGRPENISAGGNRSNYE